MRPLAGALAVAFVLALASARPAMARAERPAVGPAALADGVLVVHVLVPLCSNAQVDCASARAGDPDDLDHNLYWGAVFGHRTFALRKASPFRLLAREGAEGDRLERLVVRLAPAARRGGEASPEGVVVLDAFHGDRIDGVVDRFFREAEAGATVRFRDGDRERALAVDVVGFAGHNRMMDGKVAPAPRGSDHARPIPSFVLACDSNATFAAPLAARGSSPIVLTRSLMAPEGYVLEAVVLGMVADEGRAKIRLRAGRAYARWQSLRESDGLSIFAKLP